MGIRVVAPDVIGYGQTEAPRVPPESIAFYSFKRVADDVNELARQLSVSRIILGGHDWLAALILTLRMRTELARGGAIVYRIALWYPKLVTHVFSICTPYTPPSKSFTSLEEIVRSGRLPNFGYQLQLASGQLENVIQSREQIKQMLNSLYGGRTSNGEPGFDVEHGVYLDRLPHLNHTPLVSKETLDLYADQNRKQNFEDELALEKNTIDVPVLFIAATKDEALPPAMSKVMDRYVPNLTRESVDTNHWASWEKPEKVNQIIRECLQHRDKEKKRRLTTMFSFFGVVVACFAAIVSAVGTPPSYLPSTNTTLGLKYGNLTVKPGSIVQPRGYLAIFIDPTANLSSPLPTSLLWFQPNVTFTSSLSTATLSTNATVHYLAPSVPGHVYIALLYKQPPNFFIPPDFPYNNTFRKGFNVSRVAVDFKTGGPVAANFFELDPYGMLWFYE
ncbi:MAG: hypothetical protein Q9225_005440 [Loekoesia sp. 1 TL-2023]